MWDQRSFWKPSPARGSWLVSQGYLQNSGETTTLLSS